MPSNFLYSGIALCTHNLIADSQYQKMLIDKTASAKLLYRRKTHKNGSGESYSRLLVHRHIYCLNLNIINIFYKMFSGERNVALFLNQPYRNEKTFSHFDNG